MFNEASDPTLALNAFGGARSGGPLAIHNGCDVSNPDCTFTFAHGMMISDRDSTLAVNAWGGAAPGNSVVLTNACTWSNLDCRWAWKQGRILSNNGTNLAMWVGAPFVGTGVTIEPACTTTPGVPANDGTECSFFAAYAN
jgi:hypothetical protein